MTQLDKILTLIATHHPDGAKAELARALGKHPAQVTRYVRAGVVPPDNFPDLMDWAEANQCEKEMLEIIGLCVDGVYIRASAW